MSGILDPIYNLFGMIMKFIYETLSFQNYGIAIIIFTIFCKLLLSPLSIKQMRSTSKSADMQKELAQIQKLFKGDRQRITEETQKLYAKYEFSPMAGCLPTLLQLPIIIVLYSIVREPITYILGKSSIAINDLTAKLTAAGVKVPASAYPQLDLMKTLSEHKEILNKTATYFTEKDIINFNFLGINLGTTPVFDFKLIGEKPGLYLPLLLIPVFAAITTYLQSWLMNKTTQKRNGGAVQQGAGMMKSMTFIMPVIILFFAFSVPASLGLYWIVGNIFAIGQQYLINRMIDKDKKEEGVIKVKGKRV